MASVSSVSSSNSTSSLYNSANTITGLASGLDTEEMIENLVSGYQTKIQNLQSKVTTYEWKQEAYRDIITDMASFNTKYTSYSSSTNLASNSFFNNATIITSTGDNAAAVSASGRTSSTVEINGIKSLATAARYTSNTNALKKSNVATSALNLEEAADGSNNIKVGTLQGSMTLGYGGKSLYLTFDEDDVFTSAEDMANAINEQLANQTISYDSGGSDKASLVVKAVAEDGKVKFKTVSSTDGNSVWIKSASGNLTDTLGFTTSSSSTTAAVSTSFTFNEAAVTTAVTKLDYLADKGIKIDLDGQSKTFKITKQDLQDEIDAQADRGNTIDVNQAYVNVLQTRINATGVGFGANKLDVSLDGDGKLQFELNANYQNHSFTVTSDANEALGFDTSMSNYVDTGKTLGDLIDLSAISTDTRTEKGTDGVETTYYKLTINNKEVGEFTADTALETVMSKINSNDQIGLTVSYSKTTNMFVFQADETGADGTISMDSALSQALFGKTKNADGSSNVVAGTDAVFSATVNGQVVELTRSSNSVDIDGMTVALKSTFGYDENGVLDTSAGTKVSFTSTADSDTIISAIRSFVSDYNSMVSKLKSAYSTMPLQKSDGSSYEPLTDDDMADMSDTAIANYEEKAKTGLLFNDYDLSSCYEGMRNVIDTLSSSTGLLSQIGITTSYSDGLTTLSLNESTLKSVLSTDPDKVRDVFTSNTENGGSYAGLMQGLSKQLNKYAATTGATKGILIEKAGSTLAPTSIYSNTWQSAIDDLEEQIEKWQDKLSDKVDYYTSKFTSLETLISEMNSQTSMLSQMMGSY